MDSAAPDDPGPSGGPGTPPLPGAADDVALPRERTALPAILRLELEDVLHSIFAARQDVIALADHDDPEATRYSAERTLNGCAATVQLLLRLTRLVAENEPPEHPFVQMMAGPFGVLGKDYEVLYFNTALRDLIGLQHRTIALSRFEERRWIDRTTMAAHLHRATVDGAASMRTVLTRSDGREVPVRVQTSRIDDHSQPLLLISIKAVPPRPPATTP